MGKRKRPEPGRLKNVPGLWGGKGTGDDFEMVAVPRFVRGVPPIVAAFGRMWRDRSGSEGAGHVAHSLWAVSPGSRHDAETLDLLSRNHSETHLWETKKKLGHSRRSNASRFGVTPCPPSSNL